MHPHPRSRLARAGRIAAALMLGAAIVAGPAHAAEPVTFTQALAKAEARSPALVAKAFKRNALLDEAAFASTRPDPMLSVGVANLPITSSDRFRFDRDEMTMKTIGVSQEFVRRSKRKARAAAFVAKAAASDAERALVLSQLRAEAATAWLDLYFAQQTETALRALRQEAELDLTVAKAAYAGGRGAQADVIAAQAGIVAVDDQLQQSRQDIEAAQAQLSRWTGVDAGVAAGNPPDIVQSPIEPAHLEHIIAAHPEIAVYGARQAEAEAEVRSAERERRPDVTAELMYGQRDQGLSDMVGVTLTVPLQFNRKNRQDRLVAARQASVEQAAAEREDAIRMHRAELAAGLARWRAGRERIQRYRASLMPLADSRIEASLAAYRGGAGTLAQAIEARRARFDVAIEMLAIEEETARAWAELKAIAGTLVPMMTEAAGARR